MTSAATHYRWPAIMYGTAWKREATAELTRRALVAGYRAVDTANQPRHYHEPGVGEGVAAAMGELGLRREDLFLQTKFTPLIGQGREVPYDPDAPVTEQVEQSLARSLQHLGTDYLDCLILHAPQHPRGLTEADRAAWAALEAVCRRGAARRIGISNVSTAHLRELLASASVPPMAVQNRCFARTGWDREMRSLCAEHGVVYQGFSLLTANPCVLESRQVRELAGRHGATPQQIVFAFASGAGMVPLTGTTDPGHMAEDLAALDIGLDADELSSIERIAPSQQPSS